MATDHILTLLIAERDKLNKAIDALGGATKPVGPASVAAPRVAAAPTKKKRKPLTAVQKKAHSDRMKAFWATRRKKQAKA